MFLRHAPWNKRRFTNRDMLQRALIVPVVIVTGLVGVTLKPHPHAAAVTVPGQNYNICDQTAAYLTSPYSYHALASGSKSYTVSQYEALPGYGTTLPALPGYISGESPSTVAAFIYAPGTSDVSQYWGNFPQTPVLNFFEGGAYTGLALASVSGDEFIGGSATGFPEPTFDDSALTDNGGGGIDHTSGYAYNGGVTTLAQAASNTSSIKTASALPEWMSYITFADGTTKQISSYSGTSVTLDSAVTEPAGTQVWYSGTAPIAYIATAASKGTTNVMLGSSNSPIIQWGNYVIGTDNYKIPSVTGNQSAYTVGISAGGLDSAVAAHTPVYYNDLAGGVTVSYLNIGNDIHHGLSGVITTGAGWTVTHNKIHDTYTPATAGTASGAGIFGGDESIIEYNCLSRTGNDALAGWFGANAKWNYNEVYQSATQDDPGCGCTAAAKWWGTLNTDIVGNAWVEDGVGATSPGDDPDIWLDNGNTGTNISDNYFDKAYSQAISAETGFNLNITNNLFQDGNWNSGSGCDNSNCVGSIDINSTGGANVPLSRYNNQVNISGNQFINNWGGVDIWESNLRNCEASGEGWPVDSGYCSGGYPTTTMAVAGGQYYFSHVSDSNRGGTGVLAQAAPAGSTTVVLHGDEQEQPAAEAINDQIGFGDPASTTASGTTNVTSLTGSGTVAAASTSGFPSSGQLRVGTSAGGADGGGGFTGAILSYTGISGNTFTGVALVRGTGSLDSGNAILQVQPYKVTATTCTANNCTLTITPGLTGSQPAGANVTNAGTCSLFAISTTTPTNPIAPNGVSYYDGCQWASRNVSVTGNTFSFDPAAIANGTTVTGHVGTTCTAAHANYCGTNFMQFQNPGSGSGAPWNNAINENAMASRSSITGCPSWDSGCTNSPLKNINALSNPPGAPAGNGEAAWNNVWSNNAYYGPWEFEAYDYGQCSALPSDPTTGKTMPAGACSVNFANWQGYWQQDTNSTYSATTSGPTATLSASPMSITSGQSSTLTWNSTNATGCAATSPSGFSISGTAGSKSVSPTATTTYNISCTGTAGTVTATATVTVGTSSGKIGDLNNDNQVNITDMSIMLSHWGTASPTASQGDINGDGQVNITDLSILLSHWGT